MIGFIRGKVIYISKDNDYIIIENNGIGFCVYYHVNNSIKVGDIVSLYIAHKFSDFGQLLFGFKTPEQKNIFDFLINLKVLGSRTVFLVMNQLKICKFSHLNKITMDDLLKVNGVGSSTASKFLLTLTAKLKRNKLLLNDAFENDDNINKYEDIINALVGLGFKRSEIVKFIKENFKNIKHLDNNEEIIRFILKNIRK